MIITRELAIQNTINQFGQEQIDLGNNVTVEVPVIPHKRSGSRGAMSNELKELREIIIAYRNELIEKAKEAAKQQLIEDVKKQAVAKYRLSIDKDNKANVARNVYIAIISAIICVDMVATALNYNNLSYMVGTNIPWLIIGVFAIYLSFTNLIFAYLGNQKMVWKSSAILPFDFVMSALLGHTEHIVIQGFVLIGYSIMIYFITVELGRSLLKFKRCNLMNETELIDF